MRMDKRSREKLALALLAVLMLVAVGAMGWYILVGHSWNKAASHIDDAVGKMDGYTVILYEGIVPQFEFDQEEVRSNLDKLRAEIKDNSKKENEKSGEGASRDDETKGKTEGFVPQDQAGDDKSSSRSTGRPDDVSDGSDPAARTSDKPASGTTAALEVVSAGTEFLANADYLEAVAKEYLEKDATVIRLRIGDPSYYDDPVIVPKNGKRVGIFGIGENAKLAEVRTTVEKLRERGVDYVIAVCYDEKSVNMSKLNVDLAVYALDTNLDDNGEWKDSTYCIDSPREGELRTIIMSPSGVMTSKVISVL